MKSGTLTNNLERTPSVYGYPYTGQVGGIPYLHPHCSPSTFLLHNLGVVIPDEPIAMHEYGRLPTVGLLNSLKSRRGLQDTTFGLHP